MGVLKANDLCVIAVSLDGIPDGIGSDENELDLAGTGILHELIDDKVSVDLIHEDIKFIEGTNEGGHGCPEGEQEAGAVLGCLSSGFVSPE